MRHDTIILYGECCPWERGREILLAYPITYDIAQLTMTPFVTSWAAQGDVVAYDQDWRVTSVIIRNSRVHYGRICVEGLDIVQIARRSERLGRFLGGHLIDTTWVPRFPGVFSMSADIRVPLERLLDVADKSPVRFRIMQRNELVLLRGWAEKE